MFFNRKKENSPLRFNEKKGELYLDNAKKTKNKMGISTKMILLTIAIFLMNYTYRKFIVIDYSKNEKYISFGKYNINSAAAIDETDNTGKLKNLAKAITEDCKEEELCKVKRIMTFIEKIPYIAGERLAKKPIEVINTNSGDCDEKTYLFATLAIESKLKPILIYAQKDNIYHAFIGIQIKEDTEEKMTYLEINDKKYYYLETTWNEKYIGKFNGYEKNDIVGIYDEINNQKIALNQVKLIKDL